MAANSDRSRKKLKKIEKKMKKNEKSQNAKQKPKRERKKKKHTIICVPVTHDDKKKKKCQSLLWLLFRDFSGTE